MILPSEALIPKISGKEILIFRPYSIAVNHFAVEQAVCGQLSLMGAKVKWLICNGVFSECDRHWQLLNPHDKKDACRRCVGYGAHIRNQWNLDMSGLGDYLTQAGFDRIDRWLAEMAPTDYLSAELDGLTLGRWVASSVNTHLRCAEIFLNDPTHATVFRAYLRSAALTAVAFDAYLDKFQVDYVFMMNGRTAASRTVFEMARRRGLQVCVHEFGRSEETRTMFLNEICLSNKGWDSYWADWKDVPLSIDEIGRVQEYMTARFKGTLDFSFNKDNKLPIQIRLANHGSRKVVSLFTSSTDEISAIEDWQCAYVQIDWIKEVLRYMAQHPEYLLVIRCHPNHESDFFGRDYQFLDALAELGAEYSDNVRIIAPSEKINSYDLIMASEAVLVFNSTVSLEASLMGVKAMICGGGRNQGRDLARQYVEPSLDSFGRALDEFLSEPLLPSWRVNAARWLYLFTYRYIYDVPLVSRREGRVECNPEAYKTLLPQWQFLSDMIRFFDKEPGFLQRPVSEAEGGRDAEDERLRLDQVFDTLLADRREAVNPQTKAVLAEVGRSAICGFLVLDNDGDDVLLERTLNGIANAMPGHKPLVVVVGREPRNGFGPAREMELIFAQTEDYLARLESLRASRHIRWISLLRSGDCEVVG